MSSFGSKFKLTNDFFKCPCFCRWMRGCCFEMSPISAEAKFPKVVHHQKWPAKFLVSVGSIRNLEHNMRSTYIYTYIHIYISDIIDLKLIKFISTVSFLFLVVALYVTKSETAAPHMDPLREVGRPLWGIPWCGSPAGEMGQQGNVLIFKQV